MEKTKSIAIRKMAYAGIFLALALILPFFTGQIPQIGSMLLPMHLPVLICGFVVGWRWGAVVGFVAPLLRFALFGMPPLMPVGIAMAFELAVYGLVAGICYQVFAKKLVFIYVDLLLAMVAGRIMWGIVRAVIAGVQSTPFGLSAFWAGAVAGAVPGIILQIVLIPLVILGLQKAKVMLND